VVVFLSPLRLRVRWFRTFAMNVCNDEAANEGGTGFLVARTYPMIW
jgi:hypothetical protein